MLYFDGRVIPIPSKSSVMLIVIARIYIYLYLLTESDFCTGFDYRIRYVENLVMILNKSMFLYSYLKVAKLHGIVVFYEKTTQV